MKFNKLALATLFIASATVTAHAQQLYKWVAPDGTVSYSDKPPPANAAKVERKSISGGSSTVELPYELAQAVKSSPITLYTMSKCEGCDMGRKMLNERGIPFTEKTIDSSDDQEVLRKVSGGTKLPVLVVGRNKKVAFESGAWGDALTAAGYPSSNMLPKGYANPAPEAAAPKKIEQANTNAPQPAATPARQNGVVAPPPAAGNAPPGFQF